MNGKDFENLQKVGNLDPPTRAAGAEVPAQRAQRASGGHC